MNEQEQYNIGILAYGSFIDNPGKEISELEISRIKCETPFNVEFARKSSKRGNAPTLIPVQEGGSKVNAVIIILKQDTKLELAKSILWRREIHKIDSNDKYIHIDNPGKNKVIVKTLNQFMNVKTVLFTSIQSNIEEKLTGELLAELAINSILGNAGDLKMDGLRYLLATKFNGIETALSSEYENQILLKTKSINLEKAIEKLDSYRITKTEFQ